MAVLALMAGCSTLAPKPPDVECTPETEEADCDPGFVCDDLLQICADASLAPPLRYLGFTVQEATGQEFGAELAGCDAEGEQNKTGIRSIEYDRQQLTQTFILEAFSRDPVDLDDPELSELLQARFTLSQPSRLGRGSISSVVDHPAELDGEIGETMVQWPRYHPEDALPEQLQLDGFVLWQIAPDPPSEDAVAPAFRYQMLVPPLGGEDNEVCQSDIDCCPTGETCSPESVLNRCARNLGLCRPLANPTFRYRFTYRRQCDRTLQGRVVVIDDASNPDLRVPAPPETRIRLRHDDTPGESRLGVPAAGGVDAGPSCQTNADCLADEQFCNLQSRKCELALAGRQAGSGTTNDTGTFEAQVYSYCENLPNIALPRSFSVTVSPPVDTALPSISYSTDVEFVPPPSEGQTPRDTAIEKDLCIPSMGSPRPLQVSLRGAPVDVLGRSGSGYRCCDVSCLPADRDAAETRPAARDTCDGSTANQQPRGQVSSTLQTSMDLSPLWLGDGAPCHPPDLSGGGIIATLTRELECLSGQCELAQAGQIAAGTTDAPREYTLRVVTPPGSLHRSTQTSVLVDDTTGVIDLELSPRRLVRGFVTLPPGTCDVAEEDDGDCGSEGARIIAERLRMPTETTSSTPDPYVHEVPTFFDPIAERDGAYVLPLDPGVWLMTALPQTGTAGGPAKIIVVDLRDETVIEQGLPCQCGPEGCYEAEDACGLDFSLDPGILVTLDLRSFDLRSAVTPLDIGSWESRFAAIEHPARLDAGEDRFVDLNDPTECLSSPAEGITTGCQIRRLTDSATNLPLTQVGQVRFTARAAGQEARRIDCGP